jgi:hypothetical protein
MTALLSVVARLRTRGAQRLATLVGLPALLLVGFAGVASADTPTDPNAAFGTGVSSAVTTGVGDATSIITSNFPLVMGVTIAFALWAIGRRVVRSVRG